MKFEDFIDKEAVEKTVELIERDCKPYLKLIKGKIPLYRGTGGTEDKKRITEFLLKGQTRGKRNPKGTRHSLFKALNRWLERHGHIRRDKNIIITTSNKVMAAPWGILAYIFPIGKADYTFVRAYDVNINDVRTGWEYDKMADALDPHPLSDPIDPKILEKYFVTNKNFDEAYKKGYEIWFKCNTYYIIIYEKEAEEARNKIAIFDELGLNYG